MPFTGLARRVRQLPKWRLFGLLVLGAALLSAAVSAITYATLLNRSALPKVRVALIAPMSGADARIGESMRVGATQYLTEANAHGGFSGHSVELAVIDEATEPDAARKALAEPSLVGIIGPFSPDAASRARPVIEAAGVPMLTLAGPLPADVPAATPSVFEMAPRPDQEVRFLANYVRNVLGERLVSIIAPDDDASHALADAFDEVLQRFGTRVVYRWEIPTAEAPKQTEGLKAAAADIFDRKVAGTLLVLGGQRFSAEAVTSLRRANVPNRIVGTRALATSAFKDTLRSAWQTGPALDTAINGTIVTTPVLFDTAGIAAQAFRDHVVTAAGQVPDWPAVMAYDAASVLATAMSELGKRVEDAPAILRQDLRQQLATHDSAERPLPGLAGPIFFDPKTGASLPELVGAYDGSELVSALTQLSPIREQGAPNYLEELTAGRVLYVNDRFMYKTNVVYAGVRLEKVLDVNPDTNIADVEFVLWFRWRGTLDPKDVTFVNAASPVQLGAPARESKSGDFSYGSYRVRGKFYMNYSNQPHRFGTQTVEILFHHRTLARNNLMYVIDVLGMGLQGNTQAEKGGQDWLHRMLGLKAETSVLTNQLIKGKVLAGVSDWLVERASLSQELGQASSDGDPVFVGFGRPASVFSTIDLGLTVKPDALDLGSLIPSNWLVYCAISAFVMAALAYMLDRKDRGYFWRMQTMVLRLVSWPALLLAMSAIVLDDAQDSVSLSVLRLLSATFAMLWWLVPAMLMRIAVERFLWIPLEISTGRRVPTVFRMIVATLIFVLAAFGIVAFVLGKTITSLLATSGVLTLIVGLALQSNLRDIISGIMLNLERPFVINDMLRLNRTFGRVIDVSWRTTRLETDTGSVVALPNGKLSEAEIENLSKQRKYEIVSTVMLDPSYPPDLVIDALRAAGLAMPMPVKVKRVTLSKIEKLSEGFVAVYTQSLEVTDFPTSKTAKDVAMTKIWHALTEAGIDWRTKEYLANPSQNYAHFVKHEPETA